MSIDVQRVRASSDLGFSALYSIADGESHIDLQPSLIEALRERRRATVDALRSGQPVYGVNTGLGATSTTRLSEEQQRRHQHSLMKARAVGGAPWLGRMEARAVLAVRLRTLLQGDAGVSPELCQAIVRLLNADLLPAIPVHAGGSAGEIIPLSHTFGPLVGIGSFLPQETRGDHSGQLVEAEQALRSAGIDAFRFGPKEGIALLQGIPGTLGLALLVARSARHILCQSLTVAALSIAVTGVSRDPYEAVTARGHDLLADILAEVRRLAGPEESPRSLQAPVSFRVAGPTLANLWRAVIALEGSIEIALDAVSDSPAFLEDRFLGTTGFHGLEVAAGLDSLNSALVSVAEVSAARLHRLQEERVTGLPRQLARVPGPETGMIVVHKRAVGEVHMLRRAAVPSSVGAMETSLGQEDIQSFSWEAAQTARWALERTRVVVACELLAGCRAVALLRAEKEGAHSFPADLESLVGRVWDEVPEDLADRTFGVDIQKLAELLGSGLASDGSRLFRREAEGCSRT
jgi:histidine ammonia-lyase